MDLDSLRPSTEIDALVKEKQNDKMEGYLVRLQDLEYCFRMPKDEVRDSGADVHGARNLVKQLRSCIVRKTLFCELGAVERKAIIEVRSSNESTVFWCH